MLGEKGRCKERRVCPLQLLIITLGRLVFRFFTSGLIVRFRRAAGADCRVRITISLFSQTSFLFLSLAPLFFLFRSPPPCHILPHSSSLSAYHIATPFEQQQQHQRFGNGTFLSERRPFCFRFLATSFGIEGRCYGDMVGAAVYSETTL